MTPGVVSQIPGSLYLISAPCGERMILTSVAFSGKPRSTNGGYIAAEGGKRKAWSAVKTLSSREHNILLGHLH